MRLGWDTSLASYTRPDRNVYTIDRFPLFTERLIQEKERFCQNQDNILHFFVFTIPGDLCSNPVTTLYTTVDVGLMEFTQTTLHNTLVTLEKKHITAGAVYIWNPSTKHVLTYIASRGLGK